jgi:hypothetical protein
LIPPHSEASVIRGRLVSNRRPRSGQVPAPDSRRSPCRSRRRRPVPPGSRLPHRVQFGQFTTADGREWTGKIVNVTTYGDEDDDPAEHRGVVFLNASDHGHVVLARPVSLDRIAVVFLEDIASIEQFTP